VFPSDWSKFEEELRTFCKLPVMFEHQQYRMTFLYDFEYLDQISFKLPEAKVDANSDTNSGTTVN